MLFFHVQTADHVCDVTNGIWVESNGSNDPDNTKDSLRHGLAIDVSKTDSKQSLHCPVERHCVPKKVVVFWQVWINAKFRIVVEICVPLSNLSFYPALFWKVHQLCHQEPETGDQVVKEKDWRNDNEHAWYSGGHSEELTNLLDHFILLYERHHL